MLQLQVEDDQGMNVCAEGSLTLRRLLVWMYDPKVRLKTLAALVDFCQGELLFCHPDSCYRNEVSCILISLIKQEEVRGLMCEERSDMK